MSSDDGPLGLRDRKKLATREALSWAALRLTLERGLENVRVEDVAAEAGVSPRTFNNYFSSKEQAIVSISVVRAGQRSAALRARPVDEPLSEALIAVFVAQPAGVGQLSERDKAARRLLLSSPALRGEYLKAQEEIERALAEAIAERTGAKAQDLSSRVLAAAVSGAERAAVAWWLEFGAAGSPVDAIRQAIEQVVAGLGPTQRPPPHAPERRLPHPRSKTPSRRARK